MRWWVWLVGGVSLSAHAGVPLPAYPGCGDIDRVDLCPVDFQGQWSYISYIPSGSRATVRAEELELGSGIHADTAWSMTTGDVSVVLAVADTGVDWADTSLLRKWSLNQGELPAPMDASGVACPAGDCDGNGWHNIDDWQEDPRVDVTAGADGADAFLDPSDLIAIFSDGTDADNNGFADDICGWDFFGRDNDAQSDRRDGFGTHGHSVLRVVAAEGGDGDGRIGVCPNCPLLPIRLSDSLVSDGLRVAQGIAFASDHGARAVTLAHGALTHPNILDDVIRDAWDQEMLVVSVAGDFNAYHNFSPGMAHGALYMRSARANNGDEYDGAYSYFNSWNCNNVGPRLDLIAPDNACATGAAAMTTGAVGLLASAGEQAGTPLSAGEIRQLLTTTADDVWLTEDERMLAKAYPSREGFDTSTGYGRLNVGAGVGAVLAGQVPPVAQLWGPRWFDTVAPSVNTSVDIVGQLSAARSDGYDWVLEYGVGHEPDTWVSFASGQETSARDGVLGTLDIRGLELPQVGGPIPRETVMERIERVYQPAVTVRLTVTDREGREGVSRVTFFVQDDPDTLPGFPVDLGSSMEGHPVLADLTGDGVFEVVVATSAGEVWALTGDGRSLPGWPVQTGAHPFPHDGAPAVERGALPEGLVDGVFGGPAVGDVDGDGAVEIVATSLTGQIYAWNVDGGPLDGFPYVIEGRPLDAMDDDHIWENAIWAAPVLVDLDGDGALEIGTAAMDGRLYVIDGGANDWGPYPVEVCEPEACGVYGARIVSTPAVGDLDGDGALEWVVGTNEIWTGTARTYVLDVATASLREGWPVDDWALLFTDDLYVPVVGEGHPSSYALADLDGDGGLEIGNTPSLGQANVLRHDGTTLWSLDHGQAGYGPLSDVSEGSFFMVSASPAFGDLDGDDVPDMVTGGSGATWLLGLALNNYIDFEHTVAAWSGASGVALQGFPRHVEDWSLFGTAAIGDVSGDGKPEVLYGTSGYLLHAWDASGEVPDGWPRYTGQWILGGPALGDITGDGYIEAIVGSREGYLWAWSTQGRADQAIAWPSARHDAQNTSNLSTPVPRQAGPSDAKPGDPTGCGCKTSSPAGAWVAWPLVVLVVRRRYAKERG